jgi:predicted branched-subunit amino acid permease
MHATHEVTNQSTPFTNVNLFGANRPLRDALRVFAPGLDTSRLGELGVPLMLFMSLVVFAGSAQLAVLPLLSAGAPIWVVWATALCVNLRFVIFSAMWRPYLIGQPFGVRLRVAYFAADLNYVLFLRRFPHPRPAPEQLPYFWGGVALNWTAWQVPSIIGIGPRGKVPRLYHGALVGH